MPILNFYFMEQTGANDVNFFGPLPDEDLNLLPAVIDTVDSTLDPSDLDGTILAGGSIEGIEIVNLNGTDYELVKVTVTQGSDVYEYFADTGGADIQALGQILGVLDTLRGDGFDEGPGVTVCFLRGTMIDTDRGPVAVEDLAEGDLVRTLDHGLQPIRWIGSNTASGRGHLAPILIREGAFGAQGPSADLRVSPKHRMVIKGWRAEVLFGSEEVLATADSLVNDKTIRRDTSAARVEYFHILFDRHEIIFANGAASESFNPSNIALDHVAAAVREEIYTLFPELRENAAAFGPAARMVVSGKEARLIAD